MNQMVLGWIALVVLLAVRSLTRPSYAVGLYMLTFFAAPAFWWWGDIVEDYRWNFFAGLLLLGTVVVNRGRGDGAEQQARKLPTSTVLFLLLMAANVLLVHTTLAVNADASFGWVIARLKFILLFFLLQYAVKDEKDYRIVAMAMCLGMGYIGYEATINERGSFSGGRLEGVGAAGVTSSNQLASLFITALPIAVSLLFTETPKWIKGVVLVASGLIFNVVLMCNSRGAFLGLLMGGVAFLLMASGPARKTSLKLAGAAAVAAFLLLGDPEIVTRFMTTFTSDGQRDNSAQSRITFWTAASRMISDHPLGSGGNSFSEGRGWQYMPRSNQGPRDTRAIHNGWITEAVDWGVQGVALMALVIGAAMQTMRRGRRQAIAAGDPSAIMIYGCLMTGLVAWMISSIFGDYLNDEWGFWVMAMPYAYMRVRSLARERTVAAANAPAPATPLPITVWPRPVAR